MMVTEQIRVDAIHGKDEDGPGPFRTLGAALISARDFQDRPTTITLSGGLYELGGAVSLGPLDSRPNGALLVVRASGDAVLTGNATVPSRLPPYRSSEQWHRLRGYEKVVRNGVVQKDKDGVPLITGRLLVDSQDARRWFHPGEHLEITWLRRWCAHRGRVREVTYNGETALLELRRPECGVLPLFNQRAPERDGYTVREARRTGGHETLLRLAGVSNVRLEGLTFAHTEWERPFSSGAMAQDMGYVQVGQEQYWKGVMLPPAAVEMSDCQRVEFRGCSFRDLRGCGLTIGGGCRDVDVVGCMLANVGANGINLVEPNVVVHPRFAKAARDVSILDTSFVRTGADWLGSTGVYGGPASRVLVEHCTFYDLPHNGISFGGWRVNPTDVRILGCRFERCMGATGDGACIYLLGEEFNGCEVSRNFMLDVVRSRLCYDFRAARGGLYLDNSRARGEVLVDRNVFRPGNVGAPNVNRPGLWGFWRNLDGFEAARALVAADAAPEVVRLAGARH